MDKINLPSHCFCNERLDIDIVGDLNKIGKTKFLIALSSSLTYFDGNDLVKIAKSGRYYGITRYDNNLVREIRIIDNELLCEEQS